LPEGNPISGITVCHLPFASRTSREGEDVYAGIGGIDPAAQEEKRTRTARRVAEVEDEIVRLDHSLIVRGREVRDVHVVALTQRRQDVVASFITCGEWQVTSRDLEEVKPDGSGRHETLVHEHVHRIRVVDGEQLDLVGVRGLPELLGELEDVASIARRERVTRNAQVFLRRARRSEGA